MRRLSRQSSAGRVLAVVLLAGLLAACSGDGTDGTDGTDGGEDGSISSTAGSAASAQSVTASFNDYASAVNAKDGDRSAGLMSSSSVSYYDRMRKLALDANKQALAKERVIDQITVLSMRAQLPPKVLRTASARKLVSTSVRQGLISQNSAAGITLEQIRIDGKTACLLYTSPSPRDQRGSRMPSSA